MSLYFMQYFINKQAVHALFFTLIHSLWQGVAVALIASVIVMRTKNSKAGVRYKLLCGTLVLFILISFVTFCYEITLNTRNNNETFKILPVISSGQNAKTIKAYTGLSEKIIKALRPYENFIMLAWFIIIILKSVSLLSGMRKISILKRKHVTDAGLFWNNKLKELAVKTRITKSVKLLQSALAKTPMVIGHLKPVILFPVAAFTTLPPEEIEAILLHELAHIRRKDYLVNIVQNLAEIIFFFNPAVLWISSLIKEERENCCDDIAMHHTKNKKQFIHALVAFEECNTNPEYAALFSGSRMHLLNRVKRIITNNNKTLTNMEKIFLTAGVVIAGFATLAFTQFKQPVIASNTVIHEAKFFKFSNQKDTLEPTEVNEGESKTVINTSIDGKRYKLIESNGKVIELYVNGARIPDDKITDYKPVIDRLNRQMKEDKQKQVEAMKAQKEAMKVQAKALAAQSEIMKENDVTMQEQMAKQAEDLTGQAQELDRNSKNLINDSTQYEVTELAARAEELSEKAQAVTDEKDQMIMDKKSRALMSEKARNTSVQLKAQAAELARQAETMKQQEAISRDQMRQQVEQMKMEQKKLMKQSEILKQQQEQMKVNMERQAETMKAQQQQMKAEMEKQTEQLSQQHEELMKQLQQQTDSTHQYKSTTPER